MDCGYETTKPSSVVVFVCHLQCVIGLSNSTPVPLRGLANVATDAVTGLILLPMAEIKKRDGS